MNTVKNQVGNESALSSSGTLEQASVPYSTCSTEAQNGLPPSQPNPVAKRNPAAVSRPQKRSRPHSPARKALTKKHKQDSVFLHLLNLESGQSECFRCYEEPFVDWSVPLSLHDNDYSVGSTLLPAAIKFLSNEVLNSIRNL